MLARLNETSPRHARLEHPRLNPAFKPSIPTREMDFGSAAHALLLGSPSLTILPDSNWRSDRARFQRDRIRELGGAFVLKPDAARVHAMMKALHAGLKEAGLDWIFKGDGQNECVAAWQDDGVWCRARADRWIPPSATRKVFRNGLIVDYKTTHESAAIERWSKTVFNIGSDFQSTWYPNGFALAWNQSAAGPTLAQLPDFLYVVQECEEPFEISLAMPSAITVEHTTSKIARHFATWRDCLKSNVWPGYPRQIAHFDPPPWELKREEYAALAAQVMQKPL